MLDRSGQIKLIDFGIARLLQPGKAKDTAQLGTVGYAPPEQYGQGQTDARSDVYALGVTLHRLLTGYDPTVTPFNLPPICQLSPGISPTMEQVITRALEQNPRNRWQSIGAIQVVLQSGHQRQNAGAGSTIRAPLAPPSPSSRPTTRLLLAAAGFSNQQLATAVSGLVILITLGIWLLAPAIQRNLPIIWNNVPTFAIAGLTAYAAARRHGAAILAHVPITLAGWLTWWARSGYAPGSYWPLLVGTVISGLIIEGGLYYLPQIRGKTQDEAWKREVVWFALLAIAATVSFYVFLTGPIGLAHSMRPGMWVGAAVIGVAGWFLGDLVQQWLYLRQTGIRRTMRT